MLLAQKRGEEQQNNLRFRLQSFPWKSLSIEKSGRWILRTHLHNVVELAPASDVCVHPEQNIQMMDVSCGNGKKPIPYRKQCAFRIRILRS